MATGRVPTTANSPLTAKGDLFGYSTTQARVPVGNNGETLVADSSATTGLRWQGNYAAGKNVIINGDFRIWQRGTSFSNPSSNAYIADRFAVYYDGTGATRTLSQQTFTPGTAPVAGYEGQYFFRYAQTVAGSNNTANLIYQRIEDVRVLAGQSAVLSFWAKADTTRTVTAGARQYFGSGGSGDVNTSFTGSASLTTSWQRFTFTISVPSVSGKTIGTSSALEIQFFLPAGTTPTIDIWGVQLEAGSVATAFQTSTGTLAGELAACQRYYQFIGGTASQFPIATGYASASSQSVRFPLQYPVQMRTAPVITKNGTWATGNCGQPSAVYINNQGFSIEFTSTGAGQCYVYPDGTDDTMTISAEL